MNRYNLVVLPLAGGYLFSAGSPGHPRLASAVWTRAQMDAAFASLGLSAWQQAELLRGNRKAVGPKVSSYLYFTGEQLEAIGLTPVEEPASEPELVEAR